jgi:hypothetical protein
MILEERVKAFVQLGWFLRDLPEDEFKTIAERAKIDNQWFSEDNVRMAVRGISHFLEEKKLKSWLLNYSIQEHKPKTVALILAGNIPLVGFHDLLCVLINGDAALIKASSKDSVLMRWITGKLISIDARFSEKIYYSEQLKNFDAVIATGSDNSARYFDYYFGKYPHIIRKNRTSIAILDGSESKEELTTLGNDVFTYFGLGCRNVSKLYVPKGFQFDELFRSWEAFKDIIHHHKYRNNHDYQKSVLLVTQTPFLDNDFVIIQESERLVSPISVLYFEYYDSLSELETKINSIRDKLQCIVGKAELSNVAFGETQCPTVEDYADQVDTMKFLIELSNITDPISSQPSQI